MLTCQNDAYGRARTAILAPEKRKVDIAAREAWREHGLVFASSVGTPRDTNNVLRSFRSVVGKTALDAEAWTPREMRHSFVSLLSTSSELESRSRTSRS